MLTSPPPSLHSSFSASSPAFGQLAAMWPNSPHLKHFLPLPGRLRALPRRPRELPREERGVVHRDEVPDPPPKSSAGSFGIAVAIGEKN